MNNLVRSIMMVTLVALAFVGGVFVTQRATEPTEARGAAQAAAPAGKTPQQTTQAAGAKSTPSAKPGTSAQSEAPIQDEPTVAPDSQESADNSVTFPADI